MKKLMVIALLLVFITGSAYAAEWNFYGSARVSTFYTNFDDDVFRTATGAITGTGPDTSNYEQDLNGNARIGVNVKASDTLKGQFEYGTKAGSANLRILWGEWNFGAGSLGVGQDYTPLLMPYSNQVYNVYAKKDGDTNMSLFGMLYGKRKPMVQLKFGTFQIAAVQPTTTVACDFTTVNTGVPVGGGAFLSNQPTTGVKFPSIQAKYRYDFDAGHINLAAGYQNFEVVSTNQAYDVDSYVLAVGGRLNFGGFYLKGNVWGGQNVGNIADIAVSGQLASSTTGATTNDGKGLGFAKWNDCTTGGTKGIVDNDAFAALAVLGYEIKRGLYLEAGYGYTSTQLDMVNSSKDDSECYYIQSTIFLAEGVFVTPEIGRWDAKQVNQPDVTYFGVKWQINF